MQFAVSVQFLKYSDLHTRHTISQQVSRFFYLGRGAQILIFTDTI